MTDEQIEVETLKKELERKLDWETQAKKLYEERDSLVTKIKQWEFDYAQLSKQCSREVDRVRKDRDAIGAAWKEDQVQLKKLQSVKPCPTRVEIATQLMAGIAFCTVERALELADALIAAAKEGK